MPFERLIKTNRIKLFQSSSNDINQLLQLAKRDLSAALRNLEESPDWAYSIAYNSILQAGRALMVYDGYRPRGADQHATVVEFIEERLGQQFSNQVRLFDQMRRKRHKIIYEIAGIISNNEAEQAVNFAQTFVTQIMEIITGQNRLI